ncbi:MAG TPA: LamG-like jellyroll fold domain-containing protein [Dongiaceae bacterium]|nr:LamG-like jellyroll fold domain-containing protein [Dongiaceae bacterium]
MKFSVFPRPEFRLTAPAPIGPSVLCVAAPAWVAALLLLGGPLAFGASPEGLSQRARGQIRALLEEKAARTPAQRKMDSQLVHAAKRHRGEPFVPAAPDLELDLNFEPDGRVLVDITGTASPQLLALVAQGGGQVVSRLPQFHALRALAALGQLETLAASHEVTSLRRAVHARLNTARVDSQGDLTHSAAAARALFGVTGAGVNVGVLSGGVDNLANSQVSGAVTVLPGQSGTPTNGEGTAMLEIIHDLAPGAALYFATGEGGEAAYAQNILSLRQSGCNILVDDLVYFDESPFQDGVVAQAINTVTADGALHFSAAGNSGNLDSGNSGTWEGDFLDAGAVSFPGIANIHSFGRATFNTVIAAGPQPRADLFWSDPLGSSANDYDLFVLDSTGTTVLRSSTTVQDGAQDPYESVSTLNPGERIVIVKSSGVPRFLHLGTGSAQLTAATSGAVSGHAGTTNALAVAAVDAATAYPNPFTGRPANPVETYSSDGPRRVFFNADGTALTPGDFSSTGGVLLQKPDLAAADDVSTSVPGFASFPGTSAAAPHAAAIAALLESYNPNLTPPQLRALLTTTALDIMALGVDRDAGFGIVMATAALESAPVDSLLVTPGTGLAASGLPGGPFSPGAPGFVLANNGAAPVNWSLSNTSLWANLSPATGTLVPGGPPAMVTLSFNPSSSNLASGSYPVTVWFTNLNSHLGQSRLVTLSVAPNPPAQGTCANTILALRPLAYWPLNETNLPPPADLVTNAGSLASAGNGFGLAGVIQGQPGVVGASFRFSNPGLMVGVFGSHVDVPFHPALNPDGPFTVELWVKPAQIPSDLFCPAAAVDLTQNGGLSRLGWVFYQATNTWQFRLGGSNGYTATLSGGSAQTNLWHHLAGVYDGANASLYVNGQKVAGPTSAAGFIPNQDVPLRLGATTIPNRTYDGWVDEVAFYTKALSPAAVAAHYSAVTTNSSRYHTQILAANPVGYWTLDGPAYTAPALDALPQALNLGTLAPDANGFYLPGSAPGAPGPPDPGLGPNNYACLFNGAGGIDVPGLFLNQTGPLTLLAWVKANSANGNRQTVISKGDTAYRLFLDTNGYPHFADGAQPVGDLVGPYPVNDGQWRLWAGVYDGLQSESLYLDAQLVASTAGATSPPAPNGDDLWLGGDPAPGAFRPLNGALAQVALFTNALTAAQIQQVLSAATNAPAPPQLLATAPSGAAQLSLTWTSIPGRSYQLQFKTDLTQPTWTNLGSPLLATTPLSSASDTLASAPQRFYRVLLLP